MTQQRRLPEGQQHQDKNRPHPEAGREISGQAAARSSGEAPRQRDYRGDGPAKEGLGSDDQRDVVAPSGVNQRDHGSADDDPAAGGQLSFDDDEVMSGRGNNARTGGTWRAEGGDSGKLAPPREILSDRNGPSGPGRRHWQQALLRAAPAS